MSLAFSDTTNKNGIIQHLERELGFNDGDISGNATRLAYFTSDVNLSIDDVTSIQNEVAQSINPDDTNHAGYPIVTANAVAGQQDYSFVDDSEGNLITDVVAAKYRKSTSDPYVSLKWVDQTNRSEYQDLFGNGATGTPQMIDRTANGLFLWPTPDVSVAGGIQIYVNREGSYFTVAATTLKPGYIPSFHYYSVLHPAEKYARIHGLSVHKDLLDAKMLMRSQIKAHYTRQANRERTGMRPNIEKTR